MTPARSLPLPRPLLVVAALALWAASLLFVPAHASETEWSVAPADADGPDGRISLRHEAEPGDVLKDHIVVRNLGNERATFTVAAGDGVVGSNGAFDIADADPQGAGSWITVRGVTGKELTLKAGESRVLPIRIAVPKEATPGDHPGGVAVGVVGAEGGVQVTHRIGVRLHLRVLGEIRPTLEVSDVEVSYKASLIPFAAGTWTVNYAVENTGNVRLGAATGLSASGPIGLGEASTTPTEARELLPGESAQFSHQLDVAPWIRVSGELNVAAVALGEDLIEVPAAEIVEVSGWAVSWTGLLLIALLGGAAGWGIRRRLNQRRDAGIEHNAHDAREDQDSQAGRDPQV